MQDCASSNKIKENKYKILRMSLLLGRGENQEETLTNFEEAARDIDTMNDEIYLNDLEGKFYDTLTLEEEEKKLSVLVDYIGGRVEQRISLLSDFSNVTGYDLTNLPPIKYYDKLDGYKERLKYIREYLSNIEGIKNLDKEINDAEKKLKEAYLNKATAEDYNSRNEEILLNKFENLFKSTALKDITEENINEKVEEVSSLTEESKKSLDIFNKSFSTLTGSGISYEEEEEYKSYVENAKEVYYMNKEQEYILKIYQYLLRSQIEYNTILEKREAINQLLYERMELRKDLKVKEPDTLNNLYDLLERQFEDIKHQKDNIELIDSLTENINKYKEALNELEVDNQKVEILALLREFCLIDTYNEDISKKEEQPQQINTPEESITSSETSLNSEALDKKEEMPKEVEVKEPEEHKNSDIFNNTKQVVTQQTTIPTIEEPIEKPLDNEIVKVEPAEHIDIEYIQSKASKVMQRVGEMLGIKTKDSKIISFEEKNPSPIPAKEEIKSENKGAEKPLPKVENPLFSNNISASMEQPKVDAATSEDKFKFPENNNTNNDFWFSSDTPDALKELPDLDVSENKDLFANNFTPSLDFPDLNLNFGPNSKEENEWK
mgnify:CR=1 FL=1